jgi:peroxiredoxin (alkyl hydroperoxide reductase subunit C)
MAALTKARVQKLAPHFQGTAVINGAFESTCSPPLLHLSLHEADHRGISEISLTTYTSAKKWLVLAFIPMAWTFVCPTEIIAFNDAASQFTARGASIVFASTDSEYSLLSWTNTSKKDGGLGPVQIPLLSDKNQQLSRDYGVLIEEEGIALRGFFLIDPQGIIRQVGKFLYPFTFFLASIDRVSVDHNQRPTCWPKCGRSTTIDRRVPVCRKVW